MMKQKFYVLFCQKNLQKPKLYKTLNTILNQVKAHKTLQYSSFDSELEAQNFMHPKSVAFLNQHQSFLKKGVDLNKFYEKKTQLNPITQFEQKQKRAVKKLLDQIYEQIKTNSSSTQQDEKKLKSKAKTKAKTLEKPKSIIWFISAFQNKDNLTESDLSSAETFQQCWQNLQKYELISKKLYISQVPQNLAKAQKIVKPAQKSKKLSRQRQRFLQIQKFELNDEPDINKRIKQIFKNMILIQGKNEQHFVISNSDFPITQDNQFTLMIAARKIQKTKKCGISYYLTKNDGTFILQDKHQCKNQTEEQAWFIALLFGLCQCYGNKISKVKIMCDSQNIIHAMQGKIQVTNQKLISMFFLAKLIVSKLVNVQFQYVSSQMNYQARDRAFLAAKTKKNIIE